MSRAGSAACQAGQYRVRRAVPTGSAACRGQCRVPAGSAARQRAARRGTRPRQNAAQREQT